MILPIIAYGSPILKKIAKEVKVDYPDLKILVNNMFNTMYKANGVGLAAPQIGKSIRLFVIDGSPFQNEDPTMEGFKKIFINPYILKEEGEDKVFNEGCLSIPNIREDITRKFKITIRYQDGDFQTHQQDFDGLKARIIQHEYDHLEGILFIDYLSVLRKRLLKGKLLDISKGNINVDYRMKFPEKKSNKR